MRTNIKRVTAADYEQLREESAGLCWGCGEIAWGGCEPDMLGGECDGCGRPRVVGIEEALLMGRVLIDEDAEPVF
jgi:hypothetical protein